MKMSTVRTIFALVVCSVSSLVVNYIGYFFNVEIKSFFIYKESCMSNTH